MTLTAKFCQYCGSPLVMRYPSGDPENGPASPRCKNDSHDPEAEAYVRAVRAADAVVKMFPQCTEEQFNSIVQLVMESKS